jgi:hypothetical protein
MDRITAIKAISRNLNDLVTDSVGASLTGSAVDVADLIHPLAEQLRGYHFYIYSGAANGQARVVGSFDPVNNRLGFPQPFGSVPSVNSNFILTKFWRKADYDNALDRAWGKAKLQYMEDKVATMALVPTQYEYVVPSGFDYISDLRVVPSLGSDYDEEDMVNNVFELPPRYWRLEMNPLGSKIISLDPRKVTMDTIGDRWVRIVGQTQLAVGSADTSTIPGRLEEYVLNTATMVLASQRIGEGREWRDKFGVFKGMADSLEPYIYTPARGKQV